VIPLYLGLFIGSLLISFILTWYVRNLALARGWGTPPASGRHIHEVPLPRLGGVAIYATFVSVIGILIIASHLFKFSLGFSTRTALILVGSSAMVFLLGLYDDARAAKPVVKLTVQGLAAALLFFAGFRVFQLPLFGFEHFGWVAFPLTILWVLFITNAFNLIDGLDGLAAGSALFSTLTIFIVALISHDPLVAALTLTLAGAILGFLRYNFSPATIFLGDSGSLFIGFMLSALALAGSQKTPTVVAVAIPVVSFGLPVLETALSVVRRWLNGQPLFRADREHIHHKLLERGLTQRQAVVILYGVSALCGLLSIFLLYPAGGALGIALVVLGLGIWIGVQSLGYHEFFELGRVAQRTMEQKRIIVNNLALRRAARAFGRAQSFDEISKALESAFLASDFDGYLLQPSTTQPATVRAANVADEREAVETLISWNKNEASANERWALTLELITSAKQKVGRLSLYREYNERPLLIDINLIIAGFQASLADAVERASVQAALQHEMAKPSADHSRPAGLLAETGEPSASNFRL
jgi:UDP-GlcNAc:undecaprenyl-phosphate/decaprenyl-phosphate GlcNAc-1-phosphate transferase